MSARINQKIGNYCLRSLLGKGSFSAVYLGEQVERKTQVAIKIFQIQLPIRDQEKFLAEVKSLQELKHPHLMPILDVGVEDNTPFLVMTYAANGSLRQYHSAGIHQPPRRALSFVQEIASALQYLHEHQIIHHQVRPENLLLQENHHLLLSDLGLRSLAKGSRSQDLQELTRAVAYMAPEQLQGQPCPASDQYALGIMLYEWLSGEVPFHGSLREIVVQQAFKPPPPLHEKVPEITSSVEEVILISLAKNPKWRFGSVRAFVHALEHACRPGQSALEPHTFFSPNLSSMYHDELDKMLASPAAGSMMQKHPGPEPTQPLLDTNKSSSSPSQPVTAVQKAPERSSGSMKKVLLLAAVALFIAFSGVGLLYGTILRPVQTVPTTHAIAAAATQSARAYANAQATAQQQALAEATTTTAAEDNLYVQTTQGISVINDPLRYNTNNHWDENTDTRGESCIFTGGAYHAIEPLPNGIYPCFANTPGFKNFAFQVRMTILKGDEGGIVFFADPAPHTNYTVFGLFSDGTYQEVGYGEHANNNGFLKEKTKTPVGGKSPHSNVLTVIVYNNETFIYVNARYVTSRKEKSITPGEIGVFAQSNTSPTEVVFSQARVWQL